MNWMKLSVLTAALGGFFALPLAAQSIRGRVVLSDSITPLVGVAVTLRDGAGDIASQTTSGASGRYTLQALGPGPYTLHAIRIGYRPITLPLEHLAADEVRELDLVMVEHPFQLAELAVTTQDRCRMSRSDRERFVDHWARARAALRPHVSIEVGVLDVRVLTIEGTEDGPLLLASGGWFYNSNSRRSEVDSAQGREEFTGEFHAATPWEVLAARGYAGYDDLGEVVFHIPNPSAVLSDGFLARYCFNLVQGREEHANWIGLRFRPAAIIDSLTDISGTLWLDPTTATLRGLDFEYTNLPVLPVRSCVSRNRPPGSRRGEMRFGPFCLQPGRGAGSGGTIEIALLEDRTWFASRWTFRTPGDEYIDRDAGYGTQLGRGGQFERCHDRPPGCQRVYYAVPRLIVSSGAIASLSRDGVELYRDDATLAALERIAAQQAQPRGGHVAGVVTDGEGRPVSRAVITTESPARAAITDSAGRFELRTLPTRELSFSVTRPGFQPLGFRLPIRADSTRQLTITLVPEPFGGPRE